MTSSATETTPLQLVTVNDDGRHLDLFSLYSQMAYEPPRYWCSRCPLPLRVLWHALLALLGSVALLCLVLPALFLCVLFACAKHALCCHCCRESPHRGSRVYGPTSPTSPVCTRVTRYFFADWRLRLYLVRRSARGCGWHAQYGLVWFYTVFEFLLESVSAGGATAYTNDLANRYGDYFPFWPGIGCAGTRPIRDTFAAQGTHVKTRAFMADSFQVPGFVTAASSGTEAHRKARRLAAALLVSFQARMHDAVRAARFVDDLRRLFPVDRGLGAVAFEKNAARALYFSLFGEDLYDDEAAAIVAARTKGVAAGLMPSYMHFCLCGFAAERSGVQLLAVLKQYVLRVLRKNPRQPALLALAAVCREEALPMMDVLQLLRTTTPYHMLMRAVFAHVRAAGAQSSAQWSESPRAYILEVARLAPAPPIVHELTQDTPMSIGGREVQMPAGTLIATCHHIANLDPDTFGADSAQFNPRRRRNLNSELIVFNAREAVYQQCPAAEWSRPAPRYCHGRALSLWLCEFLLERYRALPASALETHPALDARRFLAPHCRQAQTTADDDRDSGQGMEAIRGELDRWTQLTIALVNKTSTDHHARWPGCADIGLPSIAAADRALLEVADVPGLVILGSDEEFPDGAGVIKVAVRKALLNDLIVPVDDRLLHFASVAQGRRWLQRAFTLPAMNRELPPMDVATDMTSNAAMTHLALSSICCHHTRRFTSDDAQRFHAFVVESHESDESGDENENANANDALLSRMAFVSDFADMGQYEVRPQFERYGAIAYFDAAFSIVAIYWCHARRMVAAVADEDEDADENEEEKEEENDAEKDAEEKNDEEKHEDTDEKEPEDGNTAHAHAQAKAWRHAKWVWKATFLLRSQVVDHALHLHMADANALNICAAALPLRHPFRLFIRPFVYRTTYINTLAVKLLAKNGLVHHMSGLSADGLAQLATDSVASYAFTLFPESFHASMADVADELYGYPRDCAEFWKVMRDYVAGFCDAFYDADDGHVVSFGAELSERLRLRSAPGPVPVPSIDMGVRARFVDVLASVLCQVTAMHEQVGQLTEYMQYPHWTTVRLQPGAEMADIQTYSGMASLVMLTGLRTPRLLDAAEETGIEHLFVQGLADDARLPRALEIYRQFRADLTQLQMRIDERNTQRKFPFQSFNPRYLECSVSI